MGSCANCRTFLVCKLKCYIIATFNHQNVFFSIWTRFESQSILLKKKFKKKKESIKIAWSLSIIYNIICIIYSIIVSCHTLYYTCSCRTPYLMLKYSWQCFIKIVQIGYCDILSYKNMIYDKLQKILQIFKLYNI